MILVKHGQFILVFTITVFLKNTLADYAPDKPCAARSIANRSVVCVCTADYCDTVTRETPVAGRYYAYTSSENSLRFSKSTANLQAYQDDGNITLCLNPAKKFQTIYGFGGAVTDAAAINWKNLSDASLMQQFIESYCGTTGLEYSMLRVPMGASDFSTHVYAYNELPENDTKLSNFSLAYEDYEYKLPFIKACMEASNTTPNVLASLWSPPTWMKTNNNYIGFNQLKKGFFQTLADYFYKFIESYAEEGVDIWGFTLTNEPLNSILVAHKLNGLGWTLDYMGEWVEYFLGPTIRNSKYKDVKILACDDQRYTIPIWWNLLVTNYPGVYQYLDGVAVHYYYDTNVSASLMTAAMAEAPDKFLLYTEACAGAGQPISVDLGSWSRAETYITNIIEDLNYNVTGWLDWNMALNSQGGPNWLENYADSPVIVYPETGEFLKQPMFYAIGHFSKFIPQGSRRIDVSASSGEVKNVAFLTPDNTIVVVLYNAGGEKYVNIRLGDNQATLKLEEVSITTVEFPY